MALFISHLRQNYTQGDLHEDQMPPNPFDAFHQWLQTAIEAELLEPNAMTLATVTPEGRPAARMVLLKDLDEQGFVFFTNYNSDKSHHLRHCPWGALVFWWGGLERQVRVEGAIAPIAEAESLAYYQSRPRASQLGAWASPQSQVIPHRDCLRENLTALETQYQDQETIPKPPHWGGYRLIPDLIEFWQGQPGRLHDRLRYRRRDPQSPWILERLAP